MQAERGPPLPTVSVLIAAYNAEGFLSRAVHSALNQSMPILELIIVDDASTDDTLMVAERFARKDARVRLLELKTNKGPAEARNVGLDAARGEWIAVLDADDAYLPHRLERMLSAIAGRKADIVVDNYRYYDPHTDTQKESALEEQSSISEISLDQFLSRARPFTGEADWGLLKPLFRRAFLQEQALRYPTFSRHGEDFLLLVEAFLRGARYALFREVGYLYTERSSGLSRTSVDYNSMWQHTEALLSDPRIAGEPVVARQVQQRVAAIKRLGRHTVAERELLHFRTQRDYLSIVRRSVSDSAFRSVIWTRLQRKLIGMT